MKSLLSLTLNGRQRDDAVAGNLLLVDYLREVVGLTGTKIGCDGGYLVSLVMADGSEQSSRDVARRAMSRLTPVYASR